MPFRLSNVFTKSVENLGLVFDEIEAGETGKFINEGDELSFAAGSGSLEWTYNNQMYPVQYAISLRKR